MTVEKKDSSRMFHWASAERPALTRRQHSFQLPTTRSGCCCSSLRKRYRSSSGEPNTWRRNSESVVSTFSQSFDTNSVDSTLSSPIYSFQAKSKSKFDTSPEAEVARHVRQFLSRTLFPPSPPVPLMGYSSLYERLKKPSSASNKKLESRMPMLPSVNSTSTRTSTLEKTVHKVFAQPKFSSKRSSMEKEVIKSDSLPSPAKRKPMTMEQTHEAAVDEILSSDYSDCSSNSSLYLGDETNYSPPKSHIHIYLPEDILPLKEDRY